MNIKDRYQVAKEFLRCIKEDVAEEFFHLLCHLISLYLLADKRLQESMGKLSASLLFESEDGRMKILLQFEDGQMMVKSYKDEQWNIKIVFKDTHALMQFLALAKRRDIFKLMLKGLVKTDGNLNYLYLFLYLANYVQIRVKRKFHATSHT